MGRDRSFVALVGLVVRDRRPAGRREAGTGSPMAWWRVAGYIGRVLSRRVPD